MSRGQDQLQEAADACAAAGDSSSEESGGRLKDIGETILELKDSTFAKSALSVPLTAAVSRAAIAVREAVGSDGADEKIVALEAAVKNFGDKAGGVGGMAIT